MSFSNDHEWEQRLPTRTRPGRAGGEYSLAQRHGHWHRNPYISYSASAFVGDKNEFFTQGSPRVTTNNGTEIYDVLLESLLFDGINARLHSVKKPLSGTCEWLFQHKNFEEWHEARGVSEHSGFLLIKGKPGCGKSTIMKTALERTQKQIKTTITRQTVLHYFFNGRATTSPEKSSLGLYRSLTYQLLCSCPSTRSLFTSKFAPKRPGDWNNAWTKEELQDFLCDVVISAETSSTCIFIDALDEGEQEDDVRQMISFLEYLSERAQEPDSSCQLRICLSSGHYPHFSIKNGLPLVVEEQPEHSRDIETYICKKLNGTEREYKDTMGAEIHRKSAGIFLWVVLVVEALNKMDDHGSRLTYMRASLNTIPGDLSQLFKRMLAKSVPDAEASIPLLQWVLFSMRALEPKELYLAVEYSRSGYSTWSQSHEVEIPSTDRLTRHILSCSHGLVEIATTQPPVVQFIHRTVREFLISEDGIASALPSLSANLQGISHEVLKESCVRYISASKIPDDLDLDEASYLSMKDRLRTNMPFIDYATSHVFSHAEQAQRHGISQELFLSRMIDGCGIWQGMYQLWWNVLPRSEARKYDYYEILLFFVAEQSHQSLLSSLMKGLSGVNAEWGRYGCALQAACVIGNKQIVQALIDNGVKVDAEVGLYGSALQAASACGHEEVVQLLLDRGANINLQGLYGSALLAASACGHETVVQLLLDWGADVNAHVGPYGAALQAASALGHGKVVQLLLVQGAYVNITGPPYGSALRAASAHGHKDIVEMLLDRGADMYGPGGEQGNVLEAASGYGQGTVVQLLLDRGADVNTQGGFLGNALQAALAGWHQKVVQLLLDRGADVKYSR